MYTHSLNTQKHNPTRRYYQILSEGSTAVPFYRYALRLLTPSKVMAVHEGRPGAQATHLPALRLPHSGRWVTPFFQWKYKGLEMWGYWICLYLPLSFTGNLKLL